MLSNVGKTIKNMIRQTTFHLSEKRRGCHLVTQEILEHLQKPLPEFGMLNLFVQHTSCALTINENYDPDVRTDMEAILNHMVKERESYYEHTMDPNPVPRALVVKNGEKIFSLISFAIPGPSSST